MKAMVRATARVGNRSNSARRQPTYISRSVLCRVGGISDRQLAVWEHEELIVPVRVIELGGQRQPLYDPRAVERVRLIRTLAEDLDVNLPGIDVILNLLDRLNS